MLKDAIVPELSAELTAKQIQFIEAMLSGQSIKMSAKMAGAGERTAHAWLLLPHVKKALAQGTNALIESSMNRLKLLSLAAVDRLQELMYDPDVPASVQASCARALAGKRLEVAPALTETSSSSIDWSIFNQAQLNIIYPIFEAAEAERKKQT